MKLVNNKKDPKIYKLIAIQIGEFYFAHIKYETLT